MKLIIAGSRDWAPTFGMIDALFDGFLFVMDDIEEVVSGCALGGDRSGELWAQSREIPVRRFPADWKNRGKGAGILRNIEMADYADAAFVFWRGQSSGSANMIANMAVRDKPVRVVMR